MSCGPLERYIYIVNAMSSFIAIASHLPSFFSPTATSSTNYKATHKMPTTRETQKARQLRLFVASLGDLLIDGICISLGKGWGSAKEENWLINRADVVLTNVKKGEEFSGFSDTLTQHYKTVPHSSYQRNYKAMRDGWTDPNSAIRRLVNEAQATVDKAEKAHKEQAAAAAPDTTSVQGEQHDIDPVGTPRPGQGTALAFSRLRADPPSSPTGAGAPPNVAPPVQAPTAGAPAPAAGANEDELKRLQLEFTRLKVEGQKLNVEGEKMKVEGQKVKNDHDQRMNGIEEEFRNEINPVKVTQAEQGTQINDLVKSVRKLKRESRFYRKPDLDSSSDDESTSPPRRRRTGAVGGKNCFILALNAFFHFQTATQFSLSLYYASQSPL